MIINNKFESENDITIELCIRLREEGYSFKTEYPIELFESFRRSNRPSKIRVDVLVYDIESNEIIYCIEVKRSGRAPKQDSRQYRKYNSLGLNWSYCIGTQDIEKIINNLKFNL